MQAKTDLTLTEAIRLNRQAEARTESQGLLRPRVEVVRSQRQLTKSKHQASRGPSSSSTHKKCGYCGKTPQHKRDKCPARNATCHKYNKKGHYSSVCRTGAVKEIIENDLSDDQTDDFLGTVESKSSSPWTSVLQIDDSNWPTHTQSVCGQMWNRNAYTLPEELPIHCYPKLRPKSIG